MPHDFLDGSERPLYEIKANLFKALAHPARIRTLEILSASPDPTPVSELLAATGIESTLLSQHLAVLKRHHVVSGRREGNAVYYELAHPKIAELLPSPAPSSPLPSRRVETKSMRWMPCRRWESRMIARPPTPYPGYCRTAPTTPAYRDPGVATSSPG